MTNRELDVWIAEKVMGFPFPNYNIFPHYSTDRNAAALVLEKIGELGLERDLIQHLEGICKVIRADDWDIACWIYLNATPRQLMEVVRLCMKGKVPDGEKL